MRVCVHWPRFGPYHLARLHAVHALCEREGDELVALETASDDGTYDWTVTTSPLPFRRVCVFPGAAFESISASEMMTAVTRQLDAINPDAVAITSYSTSDAQASLEWCRRNRRVAVMMFDSRAEDAERAPWREAIKRLLVRQFDAALVAGAPQKAYAEALGIPPSHVFRPYDVVDNTYFEQETALAQNQPTAEASLDNQAANAPFFLTVGRFVERKNLKTLIDAYTRYREAGGQWNLVLVGDGPLRPAIERQIKEQRIPGVHLSGFQQLDRLPSYFAAASAYVHPARMDQWGLVVNEAMACGLPILVSTGSGCVHDLVDAPHNGTTFDPTNADELATALLWMESRTEVERQAMGTKSQEIIRSFRPEDFADGLWSAIEAGRERSERSLSLSAAIVLTTIRRLARSSHDFHSIPD